MSTDLDAQMQRRVQQKEQMSGVLPGAHAGVAGVHAVASAQNPADDSESGDVSDFDSTFFFLNKQQS